MRLHCSKCGRWCAFDSEGFPFPRKVERFYTDTGEPSQLGGAHCRVDGLAHDIGPRSPEPADVEFYLTLR